MAKAGLLYVGTDDGLVLFSEPGGAGRWLRVGHVLRGELVRAVWTSAAAPLLVLAGTAAGLYRSADGGQTWEAGLAQSVVALAGQRGAPQTAYLTTHAGDLYRSDDAGETWVRGEPGTWPSGTTALPALDPADSQRVYVAAGVQIWSSGDGGVSWARYGEDLPAPAEALVCGPGQPGVLYALAGGLRRCGHASAAWEDLGGAGAVALAGLGGKAPVLLLADAAGVHRSPDEPVAWEPSTPDAPWSGGVTTLAAALYHIDTAFAGSQAGQVAISTNRGRSWQILRQDLPPVRALVAARLV